MKKSKIIIPALAIIAFSTAASIAGSVAWFTASRQTSITAGTYTVVKTSADLGVKIAKGVGTEVDNDTRTVSLPDSVLTDGSVDHIDKKIYTPAASGKALAPDPKGEISLDAENLATLLNRGTAKVGTATKTIYTAVTWDVEFTISFGSVEGNIGLYLDATQSKYETTGTAKTAKGFRTAFIPKTAYAASAKTKVYADLQEKAKCSYIGDKTEFLSPTAYDESTKELIDSSWNTALPTEGTLAEYTNRPDFLGTFNFDAGNQVKLGYTVVCWFEGTDEEIVNRSNLADYQTVVSSLYFEAIDLPAA